MGETRRAATGRERERAPGVGHRCLSGEGVGREGVSCDYQQEPAAAVSLAGLGGGRGAAPRADLGVAGWAEEEVGSAAGPEERGGKVRRRPFAFPRPPPPPLQAAPLPEPPFPGPGGGPGARGSAAVGEGGRLVRASERGGTTISVGQAKGA